MSNNTSQELHPAQRAREARLGLAADLRDIQQVGGRLIRTSEQKLKSSAVILGIAVLGGVTLGIVLGRATKRSTIRHFGPSGPSSSPSNGLVKKAVMAIGARIATQVVSKLLDRASARAELTH